MEPPTRLDWQLHRSCAPTQLTPKEYQQQIQTLLSLIAARTNLPLYDLR